MNTLDCQRCLLGTDVPGVKVDESGICTVCREYNISWGNWDDKKKYYSEIIEKKFEKIKKKKRSYDVLVPLSGGKDSTYLLYLCRKKYNLKCLAMSYDNCLLSDHARINIKNACDTLGVDHIYFKINKDLITRLYRFFFLKTGFFCPLCMAGIYYAITRIQIAFNIPVAIHGTSFRTEEHVSDEFFVSNKFSFLENVLLDSELEKEASMLLAPAGLFFSPLKINLPDYIDWNYNEIFKTITNELNWKSPIEDEEHTDCKAHDIVDYIRYRKFPSLIPQKLRLSKLVTIGQLTKSEALAKLNYETKTIEEPDNLDWFLEFINITRDDFEKVLSQPMMHIQYLKDRNKIIRRLRTLKHKIHI